MHCFLKDHFNFPLDPNLDAKEFTLLGIKFSTNLKEIPELNFPEILQKSRLELKRWKTRHLTPLGKVTVLKTLIVSKFVHLFSTIPTPIVYLKELNCLMYKYLWNNKPDKVNRELISQNYISGGLNMVNIFNFEIAEGKLDA